MNRPKIHLKYLVGALLSILVVIGTLNGSIQEVIHFAGIINEIGFFASALGLSTILFIMSIELN